MVRVMTIEDYDEVYALWMSIKGFGIRSIDDSKEGIEIFLKRNPTTCCVDVEDGKIVGAILCGHDGRRACLYHVCVSEQYRMHPDICNLVNVFYDGKLETMCKKEDKEHNQNSDKKDCFGRLCQDNRDAFENRQRNCECFYRHS